MWTSESKKVKDISAYRLGKSFCFLLLTNAQDKGIVTLALIVTANEKEPVQRINANAISGDGKFGFLVWYLARIYCLTLLEQILQTQTQSTYAE